MYNEKKITVYGFLLFLESIPLPKVCASHIESDDSCIQCNSIVRMIRIFSGTDTIKKVLICLFEVPICLGTEMSHTGAKVSWCRFVPVPKCLAPVPCDRGL
jgi:hypothetical protein